MTTAKTAPKVEAAAAEAPAPSAADQAKAEKEALKAQAAAEGLRMQDELRGYHTIVYHGVTMFELNDDRSRQFSIERDAIEAVSALRVVANLGV